MRGFIALAATACSLLLFTGCGAAVGSLEDQFGGLTAQVKPPATSGSTSAPATNTVSPDRQLSIADMIAKHNATRSSMGLATLKSNSQLTVAAQRQAYYVSTIGRLVHVDASGTGIGERVSATGYDWRNVGENLAYTSNPSHIYGVWLQSPGHYANIVNPAFNEVGVAKVASGRYEYWCVVFGRR